MIQILEIGAYDQSLKLSVDNQQEVLITHQVSQDIFVKP